ncbi:MAG: class I SAM-dependent methyltransferase [Prevotella sp.]|nr:class I SAM-dependent methyltransferase [Prevotella sp.]
MNFENEDKASVEEIKRRFDNDVDTFANLDTGQSSIPDARLFLEITTEAAKRLAPEAENVLDIGCGAGNYTMMLLRKLPNLNCTLADLSARMLERAKERVSKATNGTVRTIQGDIRSTDLGSDETYDIILAGAVLHHLRTDRDWENAFARLYAVLKPGGCLMISDLIKQDTDVLETYFRERFCEHLERIGGREYSINHLRAVDREDTPRSISYQIELMRKTGFRQTDILHKNVCFCSFCGIK